MKWVFWVLVGLIVFFLAYLPLEFRECARLVDVNGPQFTCLPVGYVALPVLAVLLLATVAIVVWQARRR